MGFLRTAAFILAGLGLLYGGFLFYIWRSSDWKDYQSRQALLANNLSEIISAIRQFEEENKSMPANIVSKEGEQLLSWRVALLPYVGEHKLYRRFNLEESWDSPENLKLLVQMPRVYHYYPCGGKPDRNRDGYTAFLSFEGRSRDERSESDILIIESATPSPWTKPSDVAVDESPFPIHLGNWRKKGGFVARVNGRIDFLESMTNDVNVLPMLRSTAIVD